MIVWRISNHTTLDGLGGLRAPGRWHSRGRPIVYCAPNPGTALLETLVHAEIDVYDVPVAFQFLEIDIPDDIEQEASAELGRAQEIGDEWLRSRRTALLRVPCVLVPATENVLINPLHPDAVQIRIVGTHAHPADDRLFR